MDYTEVCKRIQVNGEPGFAWLENMRSYGRMVDPPVSQSYRRPGRRARSGLCPVQTHEHATGFLVGAMF